MLGADLNFQGSTMGHEAEEGCASVCKMRRGVGCAMVKWKLCEGNLSRLEFWGCTFTCMYHLSLFPPTSMHPLSCKVPHHSRPPSSQSSISKISNQALTSDSTLTTSAHESVLAKREITTFFPSPQCNNVPCSEMHICHIFCNHTRHSFTACYSFYFP